MTHLLTLSSSTLISILSSTFYEKVQSSQCICDFIWHLFIILKHFFQLLFATCTFPPSSHLSKCISVFVAHLPEFLHLFCLEGFVCMYAHFLTFEWQLLNKLWKELNLTVDSCLVGFLLENRWFIAVVATHFKWSLVFIYINLQTHIIFHAFQLKFESCKAHVCCKFITKDIYQKAC